MKNDTCQLTNLNHDYILTGNCISKNTLPREICSGACKSQEQNYIEINNVIYPNKQCKCCSAGKTFKQKIEMICNNEIVDAEYIRIASCNCKECEINSY